MFITDRTMRQKPIFLDLNSIFVIFRYDAVGAMRAMEKFTQEVGGYPFLYADTFMTRPEFEEMFDLTSKQLKEKTSMPE